MGKFPSSRLVSGSGLLMERIINIACFEQADFQSMKFLNCVCFLKVKKNQGS